MLPRVLVTVTVLLDPVFYTVSVDNYFAVIVHDANTVEKTALVFVPRIITVTEALPLQVNTKHNP
jgi:flagellar biosynthesis protein FliQ